MHTHPCKRIHPTSAFAANTSNYACKKSLKGEGSRARRGNSASVTNSKQPADSGYSILNQLFCYAAIARILRQFKSKELQHSALLLQYHNTIFLCFSFSASTKSSWKVQKSQTCPPRQVAASLIQQAEFVKSLLVPGARLRADHQLLLTDQAASPCHQHDHFRSCRVLPLSGPYSLFLLVISQP